MSYEYYLACHTCKRYILAFHNRFLKENAETFLFRHRGHELEFLSERGTGCFPYLDYPDENWKQEVA